MKITKVRSSVIPANYAELPTLPRNYCLVEIETDEGVTGIGDAGNWPVGANIPHIVTELGEMLIGKDPLDVEALWEQLYRDTHYVGIAGLILTAMSGIDIALWDIAGKAYNTPVCRLLGGRHLDKVPVYANYWNLGIDFYDTKANATAAKRVVDKGYKAMKFYVIPPVPAGMPFRSSLNKEQLMAVGNLVEAVREAIGPSVDIFLEMSGKLEYPSALRLAKTVEKFDIGFIEEPLKPELTKEMKRLAGLVSIPIAAGERICTSHGFEKAFRDDFLSIAQPDVARTGGLTQMRRIANLAALHGIPVAPHNANSPVATVAGLQFAASVPNFFMLEYFVNDVDCRDEILTEPITVKDGFIDLPEKPGLGISLNIKSVRKLEVFHTEVGN